MNRLEEIRRLMSAAAGANDNADGANPTGTVVNLRIGALHIHMAPMDPGHPGAQPRLAAGAPGLRRFMAATAGGQHGFDRRL